MSSVSPDFKKGFMVAAGAILALLIIGWLMKAI